MKIVIAIDSFKGSMSSLQAGEAARAGVLEAYDELGMCEPEIYVAGLADGGEGTTETLLEAMKGERVCLTVHDPLGRATEAFYGIVQQEGRRMAVMEMAQASGITLLSKDELKPMQANTYGFGEMILDAFSKGCTSFLIGIGGSATTEAGIGMLSALGYQFLDGEGKELCASLEDMEKIVSIDDSNVDKKLMECEFQIACDVTNPLLGENGAVYVFGPQKGVKPEERDALDGLLTNFANVAEGYTGKADARNIPGAGAAGGLGFTFSNFFENVKMESGADIIIRLLGIEEAITDADIVITGEGRIDGQTVMGKGPIKIAMLGKKYGAKAMGFAGCLGEGAEKCLEYMDSYYVITPADMSKENAMKSNIAMENMETAVKYAIMVP